MLCVIVASLEKTMSRVLNNAFCSLISALALVGCGNSSSRGPADKSPITGALVPVIEEISSGRFQSSCDRQALPKMMEIARAVDARRSDLDNYLSQPATEGADDFYRRIPMGPITAREVRLPSAPTPGWRTYARHWRRLIADYEKALRDPTIQNWWRVNVGVRGILLNDRNRVVRGYGYAIGYQDEPFLRALVAETEKCTKNAKCLRPGFSQIEMKWFEKQPFYPELIDAKLPSIREHLPKLTKYLNMDLDTFEVTKNDTIRREGATLHLPLHAGVFSEVTDRLANIIELAWSGPELQLRIDWKRDPLHIFKLILGADPGGRAYVSSKRMEVVLSDGVPTKTIAHEIGHVLGLPDRYYEVWNESECAYTDQYTESDLMSDSENGSVLQTDRQLLRNLYQ